MPKADLILLHPPSVYDFRKRICMYGPISDVVPSTPIFEMYPLGFMTIADYLQRSGYSVRIINVALRMLKSRRFDVERLIKSLNPLVFGIDLHWLLHAQGSLELAKIIKKYHPQTPVIFGGLSASYYHQELMLYPQVDYVIRGDSVEGPLRELLETIRRKGPLKDVPNLTWREDGSGIQVNEFSYVPRDLDDLSFDYTSVLRSAAQHNDLTSHLPFQGWLEYPILAVLPWRGCRHNCLTCGGAAEAYKNICRRGLPAYRSPRLVAQDISVVSKHVRGPIIILGDIRQAGGNYVEELLDEIKSTEIKNHVAIELLVPCSRDFLEMVADSIVNFNLQISPETHDEQIREAFGKVYDNKSLETTIDDALELGCKRVDLFFMIGLPRQTSVSVQETIRYCETLLKEHSKNGSGRVHPHISPLAPFLDPGSRAFEHPQKYGYKLFCKSLEEHRQALLAPSWKYMLNYETKWMSRDELITCTYESALQLNSLRVEHGLLKQKEGQIIEARIKEAMSLMQQIDNILAIKNQQIMKKKMEEVRSRLSYLNNWTICKKEELRWPVKSIRFNFPRFIWGVLTRGKSSNWKEQKDMFGLGPSELIVIFVIAFLIFGPKKLPQIARAIGKGIKEFKKLMQELD
ncbi:MAG: TIGR04190 family B12-binding domain/radical SAM domain protein [bacterium]